MLSSSDVAQIFAQQNQFFMGQNQFAQNIGVSNPNMSLAAFGASPRQAAFGSQGTFGGHAPVSYAQTGFTGGGYGTGNKLAGGVMSGLGGAASMASMMAFDPITAGMRGAGVNPLGLFGSGGMSGGIGAAFGGGVMGGVAASATTMLPAYVAQKGISSLVGGGQQQQAIGSALGGFGFANSQSRTGQGFTRDDAQMVGQQVRAIAHIPEMMTSVEELTKLIPKLKSTGMMAGVRDATEFNSRFKEAVKTLRDVSKVMGTSMEEASQFFEHSRSVGFLGKTDQIKNAMNVKFTAAQTGMSEGQVMQLQSGGAQMAVGRGIKRRTGADAVTSIAQSLGRGMETGRISQGDLEDITGVSGEGAVGAAAQQMAQKMASFAESTAAGRASMMGMARFDDKGKFIGIDTELAKRYAAGEVSKDELISRTRGMSREQKISASRHTGSMAMEFAGKAGIAGIGAFMQNIMGERGYSGEAAAYQMQKYGFSETETDVLSNMAGMGGGGVDRQKKLLERKRRMEADIADRTDPSKVMARVGTKLKSMTGITRAEEEGSKYFTAIGKAYDEFVDDLVGRYTAELSEKGAQRLTQSLQSNKGKEDMKALFALKAPKYSQAASVSGLGNVAGVLTGTGTAGGRAFDSITKGIHGAFGSRSYEGSGDVEMQKAYVQKQFGMEGKGADEINDRFRQLRGMGSGEGAAGARDEVTDHIRSLKIGGKFGDASQADRLKMLTESIENEDVIGGGQGWNPLNLKNPFKKESKIKKWMKEKGLKTSAEAAMALTKDNDLSDKFSDVEASIRESGREHALSIRAADEHLASVASESTAKSISGAIASDFQIGTTLREALSKKPVEDALDLDGEEGARALEVALGRSKGSISDREFKQTQEVHNRIRGDLRGLSEDDKKKKTDEFISAIASRQVSEATKDIGVSQIAARDIAAGMGKGDAKSALQAFAAEKDPGKAHKLMWELQDVMSKQAGKLSSAQKELDTAKSSKDKGRIESAQKRLTGLKDELGGDIVGRITAATGSFDKDAKKVAGTTMSAKAISEKFGMSEDVLSKELGISGDTKMTSDVIERIKSKKVGAQVAGGAVVGSEKQKEEAKDTKLLDTLSDLNDTMANTNTLLALSVPEQSGIEKNIGYFKNLLSSEPKK